MDLKIEGQVVVVGSGSGGGGGGGGGGDCGGGEVQGEKGRVVESGYSSMVSSQGQSQSQARQMLGEEQLRGLVEEGERSGYPSLLTGTQGGRVRDGGIGVGGIGGDPIRGRLSPVLSRFAPPPPPHSHPQPTVQPRPQGHPAPSGARATDRLPPPLPEKIEEVVPRFSSQPSTPPNIHVNIQQQNLNNVVSASTSASGSPPPPAMAGAKRTSSGKVKATVTVGILGSGEASMPGSPMEVVVSPTETSVGVGTVGGGTSGRLGMGLSSPGGVVDPGRIQEVNIHPSAYLR